MSWRATVLTLFPGMFPGPLGGALALGGMTPDVRGETEQGVALGVELAAQVVGGNLAFVREGGLRGGGGVARLATGGDGSVLAVGACEHARG